ncbi:hypothetical protein Tco_1359142 [Tanacetum coccineum]
MVSFRQLHSHLKLLSNNDLKGTRTECGFRRAFATLFGQDLETFTGTMFLNMDQLEKQLHNKEFQEIGSKASFKVLKTQFQMFIKSRIYLDDEYVVMTRNKFLQYTKLSIPEFRDTLIQHMESVKKSIDERALHKRDIGTESKEQDTSSRSGNDAHADDADIRPIYDEEPMAEAHYKEMFDSIKTIRAKEHRTPQTSLIANNDKFFKAQLQEKGFAIAALKNELRKLTGNSVNTKFAKSSILGKPALQPRRNQSVVRQPTAFKWKHLERESAIAKPHHMIAPGSSRYSSNDMVHNHYLEEAKKKTQESSRNSEPSVMPSARSQSTANGSKPKPRINNQNSRNWPASKSSCVTTKTVPIAEHSKEFLEVFSETTNIYCCQHDRNVS